MDLEKRIESFSALGRILRYSLENGSGKYGPELRRIIETQQKNNNWFTTGNVRTALDAIATVLTEDHLARWTSVYPGLKENIKPLTVGLIFAGNIPAVGFHDYLTALISGNRLIAKTSSKDPDLIPFIHRILCDINPEFNCTAEFTTGTLKGFDVVIATGSNNSSRYFEYYFGRYPHIIRKNRNSIAIIEGNENDSQIRDLGKDIFTFFGLGCRNVSKLFIPEGYDIGRIADNWTEYSGYINHSGYANNYDYNKAVYLVNRQSFHDTGYLLIREDSRLSSPVSVLHYEKYRSVSEVIQQSDLLKENIQCIVGRNHVPFGKSQMPDLWDYADGTDTMDFLLKKNLAGIL